jgi:hypothetical protein
MTITQQIPSISEPIITQDGRINPVWQRFFYTFATNALTTVATANIADDAVTYAKIQNTASSDIVLGRQSVGGGNVEELPCTSAGRALIAGASASAQRTTLGLGTAATTSSSSYLQAANNLSDLTSASTARTSLGLGTAALSATTDFQAAIGASSAYVPTITGFSANPTISATYWQLGKIVIYTVYSSAVGTSNATTFTLSAPVVSINNGIKSYAVGTGQDSGTNTAVTAEILPNTSTVNLYKGPATTAFTNTGNKSASFTLIYEAA